MEELDLGQTVRGFSAGQQLFGRYVLQSILGRGGMGIVWRAYDEQLECEVALKFLPEMVAFDEQAIADLKRETKKTRDLRHHHIVQVYDFVTDKHAACISMEYVDGLTLSAIKARDPRGYLEVDEISTWVEQLCEALSYAHHRARVVHRDLKPANLMLNSRGELKVTDFGIARSLSDSVSMATVGRGTSGTLPYMSPQQLDGERTRHLDDIYSLGATIYDLLTSKPPFYSGNIDRQIRGKVPPLMAARREELEIAGQAIPKGWEQTIAACLTKDPAQRPQTAAEVAARLGGRGFARAVTAAGTGKAQPRQSPPRRKVVQLAVGAVLLLLLAGAGAAWYFGRAASPRRHVPPNAVTHETQQQGPPQQSTREPAEQQPRITEPGASAKGAAIVKTEPSGATITLGDKTEKSPASFSELSLGKHSLKVELDGYEPLQREIDVKANQIADLAVITLQRSTGTAEITSTPDGMDFVLVDADGKSHSGKTPQTLTNVPSGIAKITFNSPGAPQQTDELRVLAHQVTKYSQPASASSASPASAASALQTATTTPSPPVETRKIFAGNWTGKVVRRCSDGTEQPVEHTILVSDDERTVWTPAKYNCQRDGDTLRWSYNSGAWKFNFSLASKGANSATFTSRGSTKEGSCSENGSLSQSDVRSSAAAPNPPASSTGRRFAGTWRGQLITKVWTHGSSVPPGIDKQNLTLEISADEKYLTLRGSRGENKFAVSKSDDSQLVYENAGGDRHFTNTLTVDSTGTKLSLHVSVSDRAAPKNQRLSQSGSFKRVK